jgi:hypothetical protein
VGAPRAGGHVPIDRARVVAGGVLAHLLELDPRAAEDRAVAAGHDVAHQAAHPHLDSTDLPQNFRVDHWEMGTGTGTRARSVYGTGTVSKAFWITFADVSPSASAS